MSLNDEALVGRLLGSSGNVHLWRMEAAARYHAGTGRGPCRRALPPDLQESTCRFSTALP